VAKLVSKSNAANKTKKDDSKRELGAIRALRQFKRSLNN
jgi:hypothetical protein